MRKVNVVVFAGTGPQSYYIKFINKIDLFYEIIDCTYGIFHAKPLSMAKGAKELVGDRRER